MNDKEKEPQSGKAESNENPRQSLPQTSKPVLTFASNIGAGVVNGTIISQSRRLTGRQLLFSCTNKVGNNHHAEQHAGVRVTHDRLKNGEESHDEFAMGRLTVSGTYQVMPHAENYSIGVNIGTSVTEVNMPTNEPWRNALQRGFTDQDITLRKGFRHFGIHLGVDLTYEQARTNKLPINYKFALLAGVETTDNADPNFRRVNVQEAGYSELKAGFASGVAVAMPLINQPNASVNLTFDYRFGYHQTDQKHAFSLAVDKGHLTTNLLSVGLQANWCPSNNTPTPTTNRSLINVGKLSDQKEMPSDINTVQKVTAKPRDLPIIDQSLNR